MSSSWHSNNYLELLIVAANGFMGGFHLGVTKNSFSYTKGLPPLATKKGGRNS